MSKIVRKVFMYLYESGFLFRGNRFPELWIPYNSVVAFNLSTGYGSAWNYVSQDAINKKIININYGAEHQEKILVKFEMSVSIISPRINYNACKELVEFMQQSCIFDKFVPTLTDNSSLDIMARIEKLAELHKSGTLTNEEFESKKTELLKRI